MSVLAEYEVCSSDLVLCPTLQALPTIEIEIEEVHTLDPDRPVAFCWVLCRDVDQLEQALEQDQTINRFERIGEADGRQLYRMRRSDSNVLRTYEKWVSIGAQQLACYGTGGRWEVSMRFPDQETFTSYYRFLEEADVAFELHRLSNDILYPDKRGDSLTSAQRDALRLAFERGFFHVPRKVTLGELAEELEISDQAVSERLRRGQARLIEDYLF